MSQLPVLPPPAIIDDSVRDFCSSISADTPLYVSVKPVPTAVASYCFDNVAKQIEAHGGSMAYGWAIWQWPGAYLEAEHHGVWRDDRGELIDITPGIGNWDRVLFLPDGSAVYDPSSFRTNILAAKPGNAIAREFVSILTEAAALMDSYRARGLLEFRLSLGDEIRFGLFQLRLAKLSDELQRECPM